MKSQTLDRKVRAVNAEGCMQARMWLRRSDLGPASVDAAATVLISTYYRAADLRGIALPPLTDADVAALS